MQIDFFVYFCVILHVVSHDGRTHHDCIVSVLDVGFTGFVSLHASRPLSLDIDSIETARLFDGQRVFHVKGVPRSLIRCYIFLVNNYDVFFSFLVTRLYLIEAKHFCFKPHELCVYEFECLCCHLSLERSRSSLNLGHRLYTK